MHTQITPSIPHPSVTVTEAALTFFRKSAETATRPTVKTRSLNGIVHVAKALLKDEKLAAESFARLRQSAPDSWETRAAAKLMGDLRDTEEKTEGNAK